MEAYLTYTTAQIKCNSLIMFLYEPKHAEIKYATQTTRYILPDATALCRLNSKYLNYIHGICNIIRSLQLNTVTQTSYEI